MTSLANSNNVERSVRLRGNAAVIAEPARMFGHQNSGLGEIRPWSADLDSTRQNAVESGFTEGFEQGRLAGLDRAAQDANEAATLRSSKAVSALDGIIAGMQERDEALADEMSDSVAGLALSVAEAILSRELAVTTDPGKEAIARCLKDAPSGVEVVARLNPQDIEMLGHLESVLGGRSVSIVPDPTMAPGDAICQIGDTKIDGRLSEAMDRVREVLR